MLFDLQGKRRRLVQVVYLTLAILMGGGLVLFGIGSDAQGGLLDGCSDQAGTDSSSGLEQRLEDAQAAVVANPENETALADVVRANYQLATESADPTTGQFTPEGITRLEAADSAWEEYLSQDPDPPDDSLAGLMVQAYGPTGLNDPAAGAEAAGIVASERPSANAYIQLAQFAALAGDTRKAELAGDKAVGLAPKDQREELDKQIQQLIEAEPPADAGGAAAPPSAPGETPTPPGGNGGGGSGGDPPGGERP